MGYFKHIFNNCNEVSEKALKAKEESISLRDKLEMKLHITFCKCCKNFIQQSDKIDVALKEAVQNLQKDSKASKELKERICKELEKNKTK